MKKYAILSFETPLGMKNPFLFLFVRFCAKETGFIQRADDGLYKANLYLRILKSTQKGRDLYGIV